MKDRNRNERNEMNRGRNEVSREGYRGNEKGPRDESSISESDLQRDRSRSHGTGSDRNKSNDRSTNL